MAPDNRKRSPRRTGLWSIHIVPSPIPINGTVTRLPALIQSSSQHRFHNLLVNAPVCSDTSFSPYKLPEKGSPSVCTDQLLNDLAYASVVARRAPTFDYTGPSLLGCYLMSYGQKSSVHVDARDTAMYQAMVEIEWNCNERLRVLFRIIRNAAFDPHFFACRVPVNDLLSQRMTVSFTKISGMQVVQPIDGRLTVGTRGSRHAQKA